MRIAEASLVDSPFPEFKGKVYFFNRLNSRKTGQGGGTKVLLQLLAYIDSVGIPLVNTAMAYGKMSQAALLAFYKKHGFVSASSNPDYEGALLVYQPKEIK